MSNVIIPANSTVVGEIYETTDYGQFQRLHGNRRTNAGNIKAITASMRTNGWLGAPAVINEFREVIDGQNRIQAAINTQTPVQFMIRHGYRVKECIMLNKNGVKWTTEDYAESWAQQGLDAYQWILELQKKYPCFSLDDLNAFCFNKARTLQQSVSARNQFRDGKFEMTDNEKTNVEYVASWLAQFDEHVKKIGSRKFILFNAILFCYYSSDVDNHKLLDKVFAANYHKFNVSVDIQGYLKQIETIYNNGIKTASCRIHVEEDFLNAKRSTKESTK